MPCTAPITEGFPNKRTSRLVHVSKLVAAQTCVLSTATDALKLAARDVPPLNPVQPIHNSPAPASIRSILLGGNRSLSFGSRGPTCHNQTHPTHARPHVLDSLDQRRRIPKAIFPCKFISANLECLQKNLRAKDGRWWKVFRDSSPTLWLFVLWRILQEGQKTGKYIATIAGFRLSNKITDPHYEREMRTDSPNMQQ